jgi:hypothetical protein
MASPTVHNPCFICLEEGTAESSVQNLNFALYHDIPCSCQISCHMKCWTSYYVKKGGFECPICHSKIVSLPLEPPPQTRIVIVMRPRHVEARTNNGRATFYVLTLLCVVIGIILLLQIL